MAVPAGGDACGAMGALLDGGAQLFDGAALPAGGTALLCALAGGAGSGLSLPTRGAACASPAEEADDRGVPRSVGGALPGPNKRTWPTEMRKSEPMLFHRARSR